MVKHHISRTALLFLVSTDLQPTRCTFFDSKYRQTNKSFFAVLSSESFLYLPTEEEVFFMKVDVFCNSFLITLITKLL